MKSKRVSCYITCVFSFTKVFLQLAQIFNADDYDSRRLTIPVLGFNVKITLVLQALILIFHPLKDFFQRNT